MRQARRESVIAPVYSLPATRSALSFGHAERAQEAPMDRFHAMRVYGRVARLGSFSRAADDLGLSRAAVSECVAGLEKHLGVRLLQRTTRRVAPTAEGTDFLERSERILGEVDAAEEAVRGARARPQGRLRWTCRPRSGGSCCCPRCRSS
jgi:DNA-binding transcriptional LysR family regulator